MKFFRGSLISLSALLLPPMPGSGPSGATVSGKITFTGTLPKSKVIDMSKQPECVKLNPPPQFIQDIVTGAGNTLQNVVVYISSGPPEDSPVPKTVVTYDQHNCRYTTHVIAFRLGQDVNISNSDPFSHNIHPLAKINREWNRIQPAGTPPFSYSYDKEEFIHVKCNIHAWMDGYFIVLRTSHFAVTAGDGKFTLPDLPPGKYTLTAWHETFGTLNQDFTIAPGESKSLDFVFHAKP